jgi:hypothetical protein
MCTGLVPDLSFGRFGEQRSEQSAKTWTNVQNLKSGTSCPCPGFLGRVPGTFQSRRRVEQYRNTETRHRSRCPIPDVIVTMQMTPLAAAKEYALIIQRSDRQGPDLEHTQLGH